MRWEARLGKGVAARFRKCADGKGLENKLAGKVEGMGWPTGMGKCIGGQGLENALKIHGKVFGGNR